MKKMISLDKQSKRAQKEHHQQKRGDWGAVKPVLRVEESKKKYSRKRLKDEDAAARYHPE